MTPAATHASQPAQQGAAAQPLAAVGHRQLAFRLPAARHRDRSEHVPARRRDQRVEPGLRLAGPATRIRRCSDASPSRATDTAACFDVSPASMSLRKWAR